MGRKNRIFKGNLKASQILAVLMLIVMIIRRLWKSRQNQVKLQQKTLPQRWGRKEKSVRRNRWERPISVRREWAKRADV